MNNIRMDSHKLIYHPCEVAKWLNGENIYPIEVEISPSGTCNHRCTFCAVDYLDYQPVFLKKEIILSTIQQMHNYGLKSVICSGEGEPLLNKDMPSIALEIKKMGVDVAMSSNGVLFTPEIAMKCLEAFTWIRFSVAAVQEETYQQIHRGRDGDLEIALANIQNAVKIKKDKKLSTTLGIQSLLIPENQAQLIQMAKIYKELGVDYFTIKPYSQHTQSKNHICFDYEGLVEVEKELKKFETEEFKIIFRANAMKKIRQKKEYNTCYGLPFMTHIDAKGNVWPCINFIGEENYCYGNIYEESFQDIWEGTRKKNVISKYKDIDINIICREACRLDEINKYLYELKNPSGHVNFI